MKNDDLYSEEAEEVEEEADDSEVEEEGEDLPTRTGHLRIVPLIQSLLLLRSHNQDDEDSKKT